MPVPDPRAGQKAKAYAARAVGALATANQRLDNDRAFYDSVRREFGGAGE